MVYGSILSANTLIGVDKQQTIERVTAAAENVGMRNGIEIVEVDLRGAGKARLLRITIDKPEGVTHGDCELISRQVGELLDAEEVIPGDSYQLEVSSPGIERKLSTARDFTRFLGQKALVQLRQPLEGQRRWEGTLQAFEHDVLTLVSANGRELRFALAEIDKANLKYEW